MKEKSTNDNNLSKEEEPSGITLVYTCVMCGKKFIPEHGYQDTCFECMCKYADWVLECEDKTLED